MGNLAIGTADPGGNRAIAIIDKLLAEFFVPIVMVLFAVATFLFFWGLVVFMTKTDSPEERKKGLRHIVYGLFGMLIITTVYGILALIAGLLGVPLPKFNL